MYEKIKRSDEDFIAIGSLRDRLIKRMNKERFPPRRRRSRGILRISSRQEEYKGDENTRKEKSTGLQGKDEVKKKREDLDAIYKLVMDIYQDKIPEGFDKVLWGDLIVMFNPDEQDEFWNSQHEWKVSWLVQDQTVLGKDYSNLLIADSLLKTIWFINAPCYGNEALASPNANDEELSIPEQTATGKGTSNPLIF
ncbi:hypothetical protein Tco_0453006 [Tanacetum coccineum]